MYACMYETGHVNVLAFYELELGKNKNLLQRRIGLLWTGLADHLEKTKGSSCWLDWLICSCGPRFISPKPEGRGGCSNR